MSNDVPGSAESRSTISLEKYVPATDEQQHVDGVSAPRQLDAVIAEDSPGSSRKLGLAASTDGLLKSAAAIHAAVANASELETSIWHAFGTWRSDHAVAAVPATAAADDADSSSLHAASTTAVPAASSTATAADASDAKSHWSRWIYVQTWPEPVLLKGHLQHARVLSNSAG